MSIQNIFASLLNQGAKTKKLIFISFPMKNKVYRDYLIKQAKSERSPFEFIDMSVKKPWKKIEWKRRCNAKIRRCDGVIVLLSNHTYHASGVRWEMKCANENCIPIIGMHIKKNEQYSIPPELKGKKVITWNWNDLEKFIKQL